MLQDGSTLIQIVVAFAAVAALGLILKVFFGRDQNAVAWPNAQSDDFGLLTPAAVVDSAAEAEAVRGRLADAGIRATKAAQPDGQYQVLVFRSELDRARQIGGTA